MVILSELSTGCIGMSKIPNGVGLKFAAEIMDDEPIACGGYCRPKPK